MNSHSSNTREGIRRRGPPKGPSPLLSCEPRLARARVLSVLEVDRAKRIRPRDREGVTSLAKDDDHVADEEVTVRIRGEDINVLAHVEDCLRPVANDRLTLIDGDVLDDRQTPQGCLANLGGRPEVVLAELVLGQADRLEVERVHEDGRRLQEGEANLRDRREHTL